MDPKRNSRWSPSSIQRVVQSTQLQSYITYTVLVHFWATRPTNLTKLVDACRFQPNRGKNRISKYSLYLFLPDVTPERRKRESILDFRNKQTLQIFFQSYLLLKTNKNNPPKRAPKSHLESVFVQTSHSCMLFITHNYAHKQQPVCLSFPISLNYNHNPCMVSSYTTIYI